MEYITVFNPQVQDHEVVISVVTWNGGHTHIVVMGEVWAIANRGLLTTRIFPSAKKELDKLPDEPIKYKPYQDFLSEKIKIAKVKK
jgi:hypothetical protein